MELFFARFQWCSHWLLFFFVFCFLKDWDFSTISTMVSDDRKFDTDVYINGMMGKLWNYSLQDSNGVVTGFYYSPIRNTDRHLLLMPMFPILCFYENLE